MSPDFGRSNKKGTEIRGSASGFTAAAYDLREPETKSDGVLWSRGSSAETISHDPFISQRAPVDSPHAFSMSYTDSSETSAVFERKPAAPASAVFSSENTPVTNNGTASEFSYTPKAPRK